MADEKLTVKKTLLIVVLTIALGVSACALYYIIIFFSYPFTGNALVSWILALTVTLVPSLLVLVSMIKRRNQN